MVKNERKNFKRGNHYSDEYKALEYFYNEVLTSYDEEKDEFKFMLDEVEQPEKLDGTLILIGFVN